jgi:hypothetical protein
LLSLSFSSKAILLLNLFEKNSNVDAQPIICYNNIYKIANITIVLSFLSLFFLIPE